MRHCWRLRTMMKVCMTVKLLLRQWYPLSLMVRCQVGWHHMKMGHWCPLEMQRALMSPKPSNQASKQVHIHKSTIQGVGSREEEADSKPFVLCQGLLAVQHWWQIQCWSWGVGGWGCVSAYYGLFTWKLPIATDQWLLLILPSRPWFMLNLSI